MSVTVHSIYLTFSEPRRFDLCVPIQADDDGRFTKPVHPDKTMLDVRAGDQVVFRRRQCTVETVRPYRTSLCKSSYPVVNSVREWLDGLT